MIRTTASPVFQTSNPQIPRLSDDLLARCAARPPATIMSTASAPKTLQRVEAPYSPQAMRKAATTSRYSSLPPWPKGDSQQRRVRLAPKLTVSDQPEADLGAGLLRRQTICAGFMSALVELDRP
jgi:hypothetical protein